MTRPRVDVIIPVHTGLRPIARAVASVLEHDHSETRVLVVCHNVELTIIAEALGAWSEDSRVTLLHHEDGVPSPAGPINAGYAASTADFTCLLDSDDVFETGAVEAWLRVQQRDDADVVIQPLHYANGTSKRTPPTRPWRSRSLDGVRDRLAYRTRQHGLVRRSKFSDLTMTPGLRSGEDVIQGATLWYSDARISYARGTPAYVIHTDLDDRTSTSPKPAAESLQFLDTVLNPIFIDTLSVRQRESFAIKLLRTHIIDILAATIRAGCPPADLVALSAAVQRIDHLAPRARGIVSLRESRILVELLGGADPAKLTREHGRLTDFWRPSNLVPATFARFAHREAPLRFLGAIALTR